MRRSIVRTSSQLMKVLSFSLLSAGCIGGSSEDSSAYSAGADQQSLEAGEECLSPKVLICHIPPGNPLNEHTICVGPSARAAHLAHGDVAGACAADSTDAGTIEPDAGTI